MFKNKVNFRKLFLEFFSVAFAVFIALIANQWRDSYNKARFAQKSIQSIRVELTENKENIEMILPNHIKSLRQIDSLILLMPNDSISIFQDYYESIVKNYIIKGSNTIQDSDLKELKKVKNFLESIIPLEKNLKGYYKDVLTEVLVDN